MSRKSKKQKRAGAALEQSSASAVTPSVTGPTTAREGTVLPPFFQGKAWLFGVALFALTFLVYQRAWHAGFIWDDDNHLTANPCIIGPVGFKGIWTTSAATYYPLVLTSFWIQHALWGLNALPYHLVNIAMHAACAILLWMALSRLSIPGAWLGAALWALHPVQAESVAWITELKNTQSCLFYLLAILFFIKWRRNAQRTDKGGAWANYALALVCAALGILSKTSTVMLPVVLALCWWWMEGEGFRRWRNALWLAPFFLISMGASGWTIWEQKYHSGALGRDWSQSWSERVVIAGKAFWFYLAKLAWPHPLIFIYPRWEVNASNPLSYLPALAVVAALVVLWLKRNGRPRPVFFATAYFLVLLFPMLGFFNVYFFRYSFVGDHFQYLASIGPLALLAAGVATFIKSRAKLKPFVYPAFCAVLLMALGALTWWQCGDYHDIETLWQRTIAKNPGCWMAHNNLGFILKEKGQVDEATAHLLKALEIKPAYPEALNNLGIILRQEGRVDEAIARFQSALEIKPGYAEAHNNLGNALQRKGNLDDAIAHFQKAIQIQPDYPEAENNLGNALQREGELDEAIAHYQKALQLKPGDTAALNNLGNAFLRKGEPGDAIAYFQKALQIKPDDPGALNNLGNLFQQKGDLDEAIVWFQKEVGVAPGNAESHYNLGNALWRKGRLEEACGQYQKALEIKPRYVEAGNNFAHLLAACPDARLRNGARAEELARMANQLTGGENPVILGTLAAAYAEEGRFADAIESSQRAIQFADVQGNHAVSNLLQQRLKLYQAGRPLRDN